ncbi:MAG TPA: hypothetical protein VLF91_04785 [Candidatus Saccharimonadales bacterium]|nr:hypothetical protein [Candidatus Saccharimonadales bacterium]
MLLRMLRQGLGLITSATLLATLLAATAAAQNVTQGYQSDGGLQNGMIVELKPHDPTKVIACPFAGAANMLGITVAPTDAPVSLSDPNVQQVYVATYGKYGVLVDNENGTIKTGDYITLSAIDGVGMKADHDNQFVVGKALQGFNGLGDSDSQATLSDTKGGHRQVGIGRILVDLSVAHNPGYTGDQVSGVPIFLNSLARAVSNRPLTAFRIYAGLGTVLLAFSVAGWVLYSGIRTGMIAVGRNPFAKKSIMRNLISVILAAVIIVIAGLVGVYLILKL